MTCQKAKSLQITGFVSVRRIFGLFLAEIMQGAL
jgi:hypothetical protein